MEALRDTLQGEGGERRVSYVEHRFTPSRFRSGPSLLRPWPRAPVNYVTAGAARRSLCEETVRGPMDALLEDLAGEFGPGRIFRPYRDVRFSTDKSPYKENIAAVSHPPDGPCSTCRCPPPACSRPPAITSPQPI